MSAYKPSLASDATVRVTRFESAYPKDDPHSYVVGFTVTCNRNSKNTYADLSIPYTELQGKSEEEIVAMAWDRLDDNFQRWLETVYERSAVIGMVFTPPVRVVEPVASVVEPSPLTEDPVTTTEEPVVEDPAATTEEPVVEDPAATTEEPVVEDPAATTEEPVVEDPAATTEEPVVE